MKKVFLFITLVFFASNLKAENDTCAVASKNVWSCPAYDADLEKTNAICKKYKDNGNKRWSRELLAAFPVKEDGTIKFQYIIKTDSTFNVSDISNSLLSWYKIKMPGVIPYPIGEPSRLRGIAVLQNVGRAIGYMNATFISAREEITIDIKENRIRVTAIILNYIGANTWKGAQVVTPGSCYPANKDGDQKDSHAMAFINCHYDIISAVSSLINYLNNNTNVIKNGEEEW